MPPHQITKPGFLYTHIESSGDWHIYRQTRGDREWYELVRFKKIKAGERLGKIFKASESYPHANEWGRSGFTFYSLESAREEMKLRTTPTTNP